MADGGRFRVLIPAAGQSQRFKDAGFLTPKPWLKMKRLVPPQDCGTMLEMVNASILRAPSLVNADVLVGCPPGLISPVGLTIPIENTDGQAETLRQLAKAALRAGDGPVLIMNSDVIIAPLHLEALVLALRYYTQALVVHLEDNPAFSFVDKIPNPERFVEKQAISPYGITGAWGFNSLIKLQFALAKLLRDQPTSENYLSHALGSLGPAYAATCQRTAFLDFGTPEAVTKAGYEIVKDKVAATVVNIK